MSFSRRASPALTLRASMAPLKPGQNLFEKPTLTDLDREARRARPGVGAFALSTTATEYDFGVLTRRVLKWLSCHLLGLILAPQHCGFSAQKRAIGPRAGG